MLLSLCVWSTDGTEWTLLCSWNTVITPRKHTLAMEAHFRHDKKIKSQQEGTIMSQNYDFKTSSSSTTFWKLKFRILNTYFCELAHVLLAEYFRDGLQQTKQTKTWENPGPWQTASLRRQDLHMRSLNLIKFKTQNDLIQRRNCDFWKLVACTLLEMISFKLIWDLNKKYWVLKVAISCFKVILWVLKSKFLVLAYNYDFTSHNFLLSFYFFLAWRKWASILFKSSLGERLLECTAKSLTLKGLKYPALPAESATHRHDPRS